MTSSSGDESCSGSQKDGIRQDLSSMTFEELTRLKEELGSKIYQEAIFGVERKHTSKTDSFNFKRLNKNRPREESSKRQVPFLGSLERSQKNVDNRDPRFDKKAGTYNPKIFKENYSFLVDIRKKEINQLKKQLNRTEDADQKRLLKLSIQRLVNKNTEEKRWHEKQSMLKKEQMEIQKAKSEGKTPHYTTKKERRAKELVEKFENLKKIGSLSKHMEKRRKKNAARDRKKLSFE